MSEKLLFLNYDYLAQSVTRDVPVSVEICSASIAGLSKLCGLGSRFNGAVGGMFGLVGC
jgi:hypothetical protein